MDKLKYRLKKISKAIWLVFDLISLEVSSYL